MKKKNLLKCLALTSMLALSVGAVTSCGTQGETGPKGETGAQGPKGETGEKGEKGDTYYPVVILGADGGSISTDVISGKSGDKYTLTFTPNYEDYVVTKLYINYEEVAITDEILDGSYTGTFSSDAKNGAVVVSATFGSVLDYAQKLVASAYNKLVFGFGGSDYQMPCLYPSRDGYVVTDLVTLFEFYASYYNDETYSKYAEACKHGDYYDTSVANLALTYVEKVKTEFSKSANEDKNAKEKIAIAKEILAEAETKVTEKYKEVVDSAKSRAKTQASNLFNGGKKVSYSNGSLSEENSTKLYTEAVAAIEASSTLGEVSSVVDTSAYSTGELLGSYNETERLRDIAYDEAVAGLSDVKDDALKPTLTDSDQAKEYAKLKEKLAKYGITELPYDVLESYKEKIGNTNSFEYGVNDDGETVYTATKLGAEAAKAVKASYTDIISTLRAAVLKSYDDEIYSSKVLTETKTRDNCSTVVENAIATWVKSNANTGEIEKFVSYDYTSATENGLLGYIEKVLENWNVEFTAERLANKKASVIANLKATYKSILDSDSIYKAIVELAPEESETLGDEDYSALDETLGIEDGTTKAIKVTNKATANVSTILATAIGEDGKGGTGTGIKSVEEEIASLGSFEETTVEALKNAYGKVDDSANSAMYWFKKTNDVDFTGYTGSVITAASLKEAYAELFSYEDEETSETVYVTKNMVEVKAAVKGSSGWVTDLNNLDTQYKTWVTGYDSKDSELKNHKTDDGSKVWTAIENQVKAILSGKASGAASNTSVIKSLDALYVEDVAAYLGDKLDTLAIVYNAQIASLAGGANASRVGDLKKVYAAFIALKSEKSFKYGVDSGAENEVTIGKCTSYKGVDEFNTAVLAAMNAAVEGQKVTLNGKTVIG